MVKSLTKPQPGRCLKKMETVSRSKVIQNIFHYIYIYMCIYIYVYIYMYIYMIKKKNIYYMFPSGQAMFSCLKWHFTHYLLLPGLLHLMDDAKPQEKEVIPTKEVLPDHMEELRKIGFPEIEGDLSPSAIAPKACQHDSQAAWEVASLDSWLSRRRSRPTVEDTLSCLRRGLNDFKLFLFWDSTKLGNSHILKRWGI